MKVCVTPLEHRHPPGLFFCAEHAGEQCARPTLKNFESESMPDLYDPARRCT